MTKHALGFVLCIAALCASFIGGMLCIPDREWWAVLFLLVSIALVWRAVGHLRAAIDAGAWGK